MESIIKTITGKITCRHILNLMVALGSMVNYMLRMTLPIAITTMIKDNSLVNGTNLENGTRNYTPIIVPSENEYITFEWNKYQQNLIFGIFFFGYLAGGIPGGRLAEIIGTKKVLGGSMLFASISTIVTPSACYFSFVFVVILRVLLGLALGMSFASIAPMAVKWIPPINRSVFMSNILAAMLGAAIASPICGLIIDKFGWACSFYFTGGVGCLWCVVWYLSIYDSPAKHPRISITEKSEIESQTISKNDNNYKSKSVPWCSLLSSGPVWGIIIGHACSLIGVFTLVNQLPTYLKDVLHYNVKESGLLISLPYLGNYAMALFCSYLADKMRKSGKYSTTSIRKAFTTVSLLLPALCMALQAILGDNPTLSITCFTCFMFFNGAFTGGFIPNGLDIAPNFAGTIFGCSNTLASLGGYASTVIVATLTNDNHSFQQWSYVFWMLAGIQVIGAVTYLILGSGELQPWATADCGSHVNEEIAIMKPLKNDDKNINI